MNKIEREKKHELKYCEANKINQLNILLTRSKDANERRTFLRFFCFHKQYNLLLATLIANYHFKLAIN